MCKGQIDLTNLVPFEPKTIVLNLVGKQGQEGKYGEIRLRILFRADYVVRSRQGSSTFHGTFATPGKIVTGVAGAPLKVGGFAAGGITKGASFLKKNTFGRAKKDSNGSSEEEILMEDPSVRPAVNGGASLAAASESAAAPQADGKITPPSTADDGGRTARRTQLSPPSTANAGGSPHSRSRSVSSTLSAPGAAASGSADPGIATVRIVSATGFPPSANVQLRFKTADKTKDLHKSKSVKSSSGELSWDEEFKFQCTADQQFKVFAKDNHLIRGDEELGEGLFVVDDTGSGGDTVVQVGAHGKVTLRTSFKSADMVSNASPKNNRRGLLKTKSPA